MNKLPPNMKTAFLKANEAYWKAINNSTSDEVYTAMNNNESVAEELQNAVIDLDYSMYYDTGRTYDDLLPEPAKAYKQWVKDWGLPEPTGKIPDEPFDWAEHV